MPENVFLSNTTYNCDFLFFRSACFKRALHWPNRLVFSTDYNNFGDMAGGIPCLLREIRHLETYQNHPWVQPWVLVWSTNVAFPANHNLLPQDLFYLGHYKSIYGANYHVSDKKRPQFWKVWHSYSRSFEKNWNHWPWSYILSRKFYLGWAKCHDYWSLCRHNHWCILFEWNASKDQSNQQ